VEALEALRQWGAKDMELLKERAGFVHLPLSRKEGEKTRGAERPPVMKKLKMPGTGIYKKGAPWKRPQKNHRKTE